MFDVFEKKKENLKQAKNANLKKPLSVKIAQKIDTVNSPVYAIKETGNYSYKLEGFKKLP
jgi:hypothetical protein